MKSIFSQFDKMGFLPIRLPDIRFDGELHLVHYNEVYDNISQAVAEGMGNGLAVVGIFLKEVTDWDQEMNVKDSATVNSLRKGAMELAKPWYGPTAPTVDIELRLIEFISAIR